jgi:hypothetical protein
MQSNSEENAHARKEFQDQQARHDLIRNQKRPPDFVGGIQSTQRCFKGEKYVGH